MEDLKMIQSNKIKIFIIAVFLTSTFLIAQTPEQRGLQIAQKADSANNGFESIRVNMKMILKSRNGQESVRSLLNNILEGIEDGNKSLLVFETPRDVKGTAILTYTHKTESDDQWLYLPAISRVKRISSANKSGPFMGSEFAYEDLNSKEVEKYTYKFIRPETFKNIPTFVVERYPVDEKSGYTRQIVWFNSSNYRIEQIEYFDRKNELLKTLTFNNYILYLDKFWRATEMQMVNHQTDKETSLIYENYRFKTGLTESDFTQNSLKRKR
jgi:outer membrane lipoprotein-sorting protein